MFNLKAYNTFGIDINSKQAIFINNIDNLQSIGSFEDTIILGSGSDVLFTSDYNGTVLINKIISLNIHKEDDFYHVKAGGGLCLDNLINSLLQLKITGLENLSGIPGTVGACPIQNVGAYGVEIGDYIQSVECFNLKTRQCEILKHEQCKFSYRNSIFKEQKNTYFITHVNFKFHEDFEPRLVYGNLKELQINDALELREKILNIRNEKIPDPKVYGNAGSFFENPIVSKVQVDKIREKYPDIPVFTYENNLYKLPAGYLIEKVNCKGITLGKAATWHKQSLILINQNKATGDDIIKLACHIIKSVKQEFDIILKPEVRIFGANGEIEDIIQAYQLFS